MYPVPGGKIVAGRSAPYPCELIPIPSGILNSCILLIQGLPLLVNLVLGASAATCLGPHVCVGIAPIAFKSFLDIILSELANIGLFPIPKNLALGT